MDHTILLIQHTADKATRTYYDYPTMAQCAEGLLRKHHRHPNAAARLSVVDPAAFHCMGYF